MEWLESAILVALCSPAVLLLAGCSREPNPGKILPDRVGDWRATSEVETYDPETIFGYIDGHAEVYLAYGLKQCASRRYRGPTDEREIVVDLFEMATSDDAFGVFTHDLDGEVVPVGHDGLYRFGWLSFWKGRWFVSIYVEEETDDTRDAAFALGHAVAARIEEDANRPSLIGVLPAAGLEPRSVRFLRSEQILRTHLYLGDEPVFGLAPDTAAVLAKVVREGWSAHVAVVDFPTDQRALTAFEQFTSRFLDGAGAPEVARDPAGRWYGARVGGSRLTAVIGAGTEELATALLDDLMPGGT